VEAGGGFQPGKQAGEGGLGQGQFDRLGSGYRALDHHLTRSQGGRLGGVGRAPGNHSQVAAAEDLLWARRDAEYREPAQLLQLVGSHAKPPRTAPGGLAQAALDRAAAALEQVPADRDGGRRQHTGRQEDREDPDRIERQCSVH
jgi:hypothetical protein